MDKHLEYIKEIEIQGDSLNKLYPIITMVSAELHFKDHFYEVRLTNLNNTDNYAGFAVLGIDPSDQSKTPIGAFTLLLLGNNRIMLRIPPRSRWHHDFSFTPLEIIKLGLIGNDKNEQEFYDELFSQFIKSLQDRLTHYGLRVTPVKRIWRWIREGLSIYNKVKP